MRQKLPREMFARIFLAGGGGIGMGQHMAGGDSVAVHNISAQANHRLDVHLRIRRQALSMPAIDDLDANGMGIDVAFAFPAAAPGVPSAGGLRHDLKNPPVFPHKVMAGDF